MVKISRIHHKRVRGRGTGRIRRNPRKKGRTKRMRFEELQREVAKGYVGKPVPKKYQSKWGKTYSRAEAQEVGKAVAGKMFWKTRGKRRGSQILRKAR